MFKYEYPWTVKVNGVPVNSEPVTNGHGEVIEDGTEHMRRQRYNGIEVRFTELRDPFSQGGGVAVPCWQWSELRVWDALADLLPGQRREYFTPGSITHGPVLGPEIHKTA